MRAGAVFGFENHVFGTQKQSLRAQAPRNNPPKGGFTRWHRFALSLGLMHVISARACHLKHRVILVPIQRRFASCLRAL
jgi:hypothetical protein